MIYKLAIAAGLIIGSIYYTADQALSSEPAPRSPPPGIWLNNAYGYYVNPRVQLDPDFQYAHNVCRSGRRATRMSYFFCMGLHRWTREISSGT
jgi:hypothetical protein